VADLQKVIALEPPARRQLYTAELTALQARGQAVTQQAQAAAEAVRHASRTVAESCMIEEVGDEPEEEQQVRGACFDMFGWTVCDAGLRLPQGGGVE
jgi:hypothetical protein